MSEEDEEEESSQVCELDLREVEEEERGGWKRGVKKEVTKSVWSVW